MISLYMKRSLQNRLLDLNLEIKMIKSSYLLNFYRYTSQNKEYRISNDCLMINDDFRFVNNYLYYTYIL